MSVALGVPPLLARVEITPRDFDVAEPLASIFNIANQGVFDIYNVKYLCGLNDLRMHFGHAIVHVTDSVMESLIEVSDVLKPTGGYDFDCREVNVSSSQLESANLDIIVIFRPAWSLFQKFKCERFVLDKPADDIARWRERPAGPE